MKATETVFPSIAHPYAGGLPIQQGLTKREYFAGLAMQAIITKHPAIDGPDNLLDAQVSKGAVSYADALLVELSKEHK